jgi:hypothetical protein
VRVLDFDGLTVLRTGITTSEEGWEFRIGEPKTQRWAAVRVTPDDVAELLDVPTFDREGLGKLVGLIAKRVQEALVEVQT